MLLSTWPHQAPSYPVYFWNVLPSVSLCVSVLASWAPVQCPEQPSVSRLRAGLTGRKCSGHFRARLSKAPANLSLLALFSLPESPGLGEFLHQRSLIISLARVCSLSLTLTLAQTHTHPPGTDT